MNKIKDYKLDALSFVAGICYALGFPFKNDFSLFFMPVLAFYLINLCLDKENSLFKQLRLGLFYSLGFYAVGFYWIPHTLKEFGNLPFPFNQFLGLFFSIFLIPQIYFYILVKRKISHPLYLALIYPLLEWLIPQQFPAHLGHGFISLTPKLNLFFAPYLGAAFYSFLVALLALKILDHQKTKKIPKLSYVFVIISLILHIPVFKINTNQNSIPKRLSVRIVQPNVGNFIKLQSEKGEPTTIKNVLERAFDLSTQDIRTKRDLIIWPETSFPVLMYSDLMKTNPDYAIPPMLSTITSETGAELFIGGYDTKSNATLNNYKSDYNAAFHFSSNGTLSNVYHKMKLIPFGEALPFGPFNQFLSQLITNIAYFAEGERFQLFKTETGLTFISAICYEILFSDLIRDALNASLVQPLFLINLTNDSWYGKTSEPFQHLFLSRWRAIEFNIPIIRSTNTGITSVLYPDGSESKRLELHKQGVLDLDLSIYDRKKSIYQQYGILGFLILGTLMIFFNLIIFERKTFFK